MTHILVATPAYNGQVTIPYHRSMMKMVRLCESRGIQVGSHYTVSGTIGRARNSAVGAFMANECFTHLLTVDADMGWPPEAILRLLDADKDVVGCTYPKRQLHDQPCFVVGLEQGQTVDEHGFIQVIYVGGGFTLIKRETIAKMIDYYPWAEYEDEGVPDKVWDFFGEGPADNSKYQTDDVAFCRRVYEAGMDVWADVMMPLSHTGPVTFELGPMSQLMKTPGEQT
jgi:hypothetical protein